MRKRVHVLPDFGYEASRMSSGRTASLRPGTWNPNARFTPTTTYRIMRTQSPSLQFPDHQLQFLRGRPMVSPRPVGKELARCIGSHFFFNEPQASYSYTLSLLGARARAA